MNCEGCGNKAAVVTRTGYENGQRYEICNSSNCGNLATPWHPDVYFRRPEMVENLADANHPFGQVVESRRHKARILREQGLREAGDMHHGSRDKGAQRREFKLTPELTKKRDEAVQKAIVQFKKQRNVPVSAPLRFKRRSK